MPKYRVFVSYMATKVIGEIEANNENEAIVKLEFQAPTDISLCYQCSDEFIDRPKINLNSFYAEKI